MLVMRATTRCFGSLTDAGLWKYMFLGLVLTALLFAGVQAMVWSFLLNTSWLQEGWMEWTADILGGAFAFIVGLFVFPIIVPVIVSLFDTQIAGHVERREYPEIGGASYSPTIMEEVTRALKFLMVAIGLNILILPLYLLPLANLPIYYALNGYLLGREFFEAVAARHYSFRELTGLRKKHRFTVWLAGVGVAISATIPIINLFAPVLAVVLMVHLLQLVRPALRVPDQGQIEQETIISN